MKNLVLILFFLTWNLNSQSDSINSIFNHSSRIIPADDIVDDNILTENDYYKLLVEQSKTQNDNYMSLIQWSLGVSFAFLLAIIGSQIFFNYRINKKEIEYIKIDIDKKITDLRNELISDFEKKFGEIKRNLNNEYINNAKSINTKIKEDYIIQKERFDFKLELVEKTLNQTIKSIEKEVQKNAGDLWKLKGVESNALSSFISSALLQIELNADVQYIIKDIIEILKGMGEIHISNYENLEKLAEKLSIKNKGLSQNLEANFKDKPVYKYAEKSINPFGFSSLLGGFPITEYVKNKK